MTVENDLVEEIEKWTAKLDAALSATSAADGRGRKMLSNIKAYRRDSKHFFERGELIKSFECLIWAWALFEMGKDFKHLE